MLPRLAAVIIVMRTYMEKYIAMQKQYCNNVHIHCTLHVPKLHVPKYITCLKILHDTDGSFISQGYATLKTEVLKPTLVILKPL
jgi:hypothetical protein